MMHPGDASLGAPPQEFVNCRCAVLPIVKSTDELEDTGIEGLSPDYVTPSFELDKNLTEENVREISKKIFGRELVPAELATFSGASRGETVLIKGISGKHFKLEVRDSGNIAAMNRLIHGQDGNVHITNLSIDLKKQRTGEGTEIFSNQVKIARSYGIKDITTVGGGYGPQAGYSREAELNGYYTWPRLGYDGPIPERQLDILKRDVADNLMEPGLADAQYLSDLLKTKRGRDWWKAFGDEVDLEFDLSDGSQSLEVLNAYLAAKAK